MSPSPERLSSLSISAYGRITAAPDSALSSRIWNVVNRTSILLFGSFGAGRGANMRQDIHGEFRVEAAMVDSAGKHGNPGAADGIRRTFLR
jgi:hypothetical protein